MADLGAGIGGGVGGGAIISGSGGGNIGLIPSAPSDPVEMRRLNFQTPGMMSHPPISIMQLAHQIESLKSNDNQKFSQEYEVSNNYYENLLSLFVNRNLPLDCFYMYSLFEINNFDINSLFNFF